MGEREGHYYELEFDFCVLDLSDLALRQAGLFAGKEQLMPDDIPARSKRHLAWNETVGFNGHGNKHIEGEKDHSDREEKNGVAEHFSCTSSPLISILCVSSPDGPDEGVAIYLKPTLNVRRTLCHRLSARRN